MTILPPRPRNWRERGPHGLLRLVAGMGVVTPAPAVPSP